MFSVLVVRCLYGTAPAYLSDELHRVADSGTRRRLQSTSSPALVVPSTRRTTIGDRSFPVAGVRVWKALPSFVTDSSAISAFKRHLKTYLCARSCLDCHTVACPSRCFNLVQCSRSCSLYDTIRVMMMMMMISQ